MKQIFAGLMLFAFISANAQTSTTVKATGSQPKLTIEKLRAVILWDEQQHQAKAPINLNSAVFSGTQNKPSVVRINYVEQRRSALLEGMSYGLLLARSFTKYANTPNMNYSSMEKHYNVHRNLTGTGNSNALFGKQ